MIDRKHTNQRLSGVVVHGETVYLSGQVALKNAGASVEEQTKEILESIEELLEEVGSGKDKMLFANVWLSDIKDVEVFNSLWDEWVPEGQAPARACVEARLVSDGFNVEVSVIAALG